MNRIAGLALGAALLAAPCAAQPAAGVPDGFTFVAGGDMIGPYHPFPGADDAGFAQVAALFRHADVGFANQEGSIFDVAAFAGWPAAENGGGYPLQPPSTAVEMKAAGIGLVSKANNHATDFGTEGLVATLKSLADAGIAQGGAGLSDVEARAPAYLSTSKGVVALVDTASTFPPMSVAGPKVERRGVVTGPRPGISALHVREVRLVTPEQLATLRDLGADDYSKPGEARIADKLFRVSDKTGSVWEMEPADEAAILASVRQARTKARFVLFSIHAHETAGDHDVPPPVDYEAMVLHKANEAPSPDDPHPAGFEPELFHAAIDAGADAVVRTGPHVLNGIEIYKGRPIFYGLGSLFFDFGGRRGYTTPAGEALSFPDEWFETVVPVCTFRGGKVSEIRLYPMVLDSSGPATAGVPHPADPARARRILERLRAQSLMFGTHIAIENGVGVIRG
jgi:poly-gamma-glutamate capsule biosynthesis protein CapA/YwtB (metallophosphatase superfamily)